MSSHAGPAPGASRSADGQAPLSAVAADRPVETGISTATEYQRGSRSHSLSVCRAWEPVVRRVGLLVVLYALPLIFLSQPVLDPDIWWHLRTGQWLVEHTRVPATDPFSTFGHGRPWVAYSWMFEILVFGLFRTSGLLGIWLLRTVMVYAVAVALHWLLGSREPRFVRIAVLLAAAFLALLTIDSERPWHFSILFCILTLAAIEQIRSGRRPQWIWLLPPMFALWTNLHIQFVYGLGLLGLAVVCGFIDDRVLERAAQPRRPGGRLLLLSMLTACLLATGINPYGFGVYRPVLEYGGHSLVFNCIQEHRAPEFRTLSDWCLVGLAGAAAFKLGRRPSRQAYLLTLLAVAVYLGFHSARDGWVLVLAALVVLTSEVPRSISISERFVYTWPRVLAVSGLVLLLAGLTAWWNDISPGRLERAVEHTYPEQAADYLVRNVSPGPIYNQLNWGGYLIWRLPGYPVTIDGRTNLHGDERIDRSERIWSGRCYRWTDSEFQTARIIVADRTTALAAILRLDPLFEPVHEDHVAVVFRSRARAESPRNGSSDAGSIPAYGSHRRIGLNRRRRLIAAGSAVRPVGWDSRLSRQ